MRGRGIRGMQYTFALKPPAATATTTNVTNTNRPSKSANPAASNPGPRPRRATDAHKADAQPEQASTRPRSATTTQTTGTPQNDIELPPHDPNDADVDTEHDEDFDMDGTGGAMVPDAEMLGLMDDGEGSLLRFETLFGGFGPDQLLVNPHAPSFTQPGLSYGEADSTAGEEGRDVTVGRPTFEIQLEELLSGADDDSNTNKSGASIGEKHEREETWSNTDADANSTKPRMSRTNTNANARAYNTASMGVIGLNPDADSVPLTHAYAHPMYQDQVPSTTPLGTPTTTNNGTGFQWAGSGSPPLMPAQSAPTSPAFALRPVRYGQQTDTFGTGSETYSPDSYDFGTGVNGGNGVPPLSLPVSYTTTTAGGHVTSSSAGGQLNSSSGNGGARRAGSGGGGNGGHHRAHSTGGLGGGFKHPATININTANAGPGSKGSTPTSSPTSRYDRTPGGNTNGGGNGAPSATPPPTRGRSGSNALPLHGNTAPGGVKSECANCGANSTPLWRRGLNDELNCEFACALLLGLYGIFHCVFGRSFVERFADSLFINTC